MSATLAPPTHRLRLVPVGLREANEFVSRHHRHSKRAAGHKFSVGAAAAGDLIGVAIAGRPVARHCDDGLTLEVVRVCVVDDAARNVCSLLYGACGRAGKALGYRRLITYTLRSESGASVRASAFAPVAFVRAENWDRPGRRRGQSRGCVERVRWERAAWTGFVSGFAPGFASRFGTRFALRRHRTALEADRQAVWPAPILPTSTPRGVGA